MPKLARPTRPLADVNLLPRQDGSHEVVVCFMPDPDLLVGEGESRSFLALDASTSLKRMYGFGGPFGGDPNYVQAVARKLGATLCAVSKTGKSSAVYWAVGTDGSRLEEIGEFDEPGWEGLSITGPRREKWGKGTKLLPAIRHGVEQIALGSELTIGVVLTDGIIEDEKECTDYCLKIGREMASGRRSRVKLILIGIGHEVDEGQLERFDNMFEGTGIDYDLWSHGMVESMQDEADILAVLYGELIDEDTTVASSGRVEDASGRQLAAWPDGMPGKFRFVLPRGQMSFTIKAGSQKVVQDVSDAVAKH